MTINFGDEQIIVFKPEEYDLTNRLYPALYLAGNPGNEFINNIVSGIYGMVNANEIGPLVVLVVPDELVGRLSSIMPELENELRLRKDFHFRSIIGCRENAGQICDLAISQTLFSSCVLVDAYLHKEQVIKMIEEMPEGALKKSPFFIVTPDKGNYYEGNGNLHMLFRDKEIKHEYRVVGFEDLGSWGLEEMIYFISENFHR